LAQHFAQGFRRADDILKHRVAVDLFSQRQIFVPCAFLGPDTVFYVGSRCVPANHLTLLISEWVVTSEEPAILAVVSTRSMLNLEWDRACQRNLPLFPQFNGRGVCAVS
jgi:hypothetical protein